MEGFPGWALLAIFAAYALAGASLLIVVVVGGLWLAGRPKQALKLFAASLLGVAIAAALMALATRAESVMDRGRSLSLLFALSLLLAGAGQFVAALRNPRSYAAALGCAAGSMAFAVGPLMSGGHLLLRWAIAATSSLLLAVASLMIAVLSRRSGTGNGGPGSPSARPRSRKRMLLMLGLVNLVAFGLAVVYLETGDFIVLNDEFSSLITNTHWRLAFAVLDISAMISATIFVFWPSGSRPEPPPVSNPEHH